MTDMGTVTVTGTGMGTGSGTWIDEFSFNLLLN